MQLEVFGLNRQVIFYICYFYESFHALWDPIISHEVVLPSKVQLFWPFFCFYSLFQIVSLNEPEIFLLFFLLFFFHFNFKLYFWFSSGLGGEKFIGEWLWIVVLKILREDSVLSKRIQKLIWLIRRLKHHVLVVNAYRRVVNQFIVIELNIVEIPVFLLVIWGYYVFLVLKWRKINWISFFCNFA